MRVNPFLIIYYFIVEYILIAFRQLQTFFGKQIPAEWKNGTKIPFLIVPGIFVKWPFFITIGNYLNKKGYPILIVKELGYNLKPINECSEIIDTYIQTHHLVKFNLFGYSKGGLIAKYMLYHSKYKDNIVKIVTVATPYSGSLFGCLYFFNLWELFYNSKTLQTLSYQTTKDNLILNLYPEVDNHIFPNKNAVLNSAINIKIPIVGHTRVLESNEIRRIIDKQLES